MELVVVSMEIVKADDKKALALMSNDSFVELSFPYGVPDDKVFNLKSYRFKTESQMRLQARDFNSMRKHEEYPNGHWQRSLELGHDYMARGYR